MFDLGGKVALVTGGNGGLGLGMAQGLAQAGARVVIAARNPEKSAAAVETLKALGSDSFAVAIDVADEASVQQAVDDVAARCGRLDILVNNAGTTVRKPVDQLTLDEWNLVLQTNLTSAFLVSRAAHPHMKRGGGGKIVNVGSMMSIFGAAYSPAYAASKAGVVQLTKSTALSWAADNIQVNAILPGWFQTEMTDGARAQVAGLYERVVARTAAGRWGRPADIAGTAVFLASPAADYVTGVSIPVDGGYSTMG
ncbi:2-deoxy-D-gluconate 3-dehydrogenase [Variovorax sp. PDC80]|uniref:SDR family NAD(P)-dependent oxidoreductase n=1 Tax=Variovorax sp. PDC80 TaxID=1882827 RepID=UPI0008EB152B|nr:glucose 1-dehydrogenase [Variovorax sp. PDC80]SFP62418.1 2-deoxy-D-gluconate 3-dehydrogenase [Variovorax sp. PDC80]